MSCAAVVPDKPILIIYDPGHPDFIQMDSHQLMAFRSGVDGFQGLMAPVKYGILIQLQLCIAQHVFDV